MRELRQFVIGEPTRSNIINNISLSRTSTLSTLSRNPCVSIVSAKEKVAGFEIRCQIVLAWGFGATNFSTNAI
jgi:hypothetical protein